MAEERHFRTWVNGITAADTCNKTHGSGHIALHVHGVGDHTEPMVMRGRYIGLRKVLLQESTPGREATAVLRRLLFIGYLRPQDGAWMRVAR